MPEVITDYPEFQATPADKRFAWRWDDGGRVPVPLAGSGDCVIRALTIATGLPYLRLYTALKPRPEHVGVPWESAHAVLSLLGWKRTDTKRQGLNLRSDHLPADVSPLIVLVPRHMTVIVDGTILDMFDPAEKGRQPVLAYWTPPPSDNRIVD